MKKIVSFILIAISGVTAVFAQDPVVSFTLKAGSTPSSAKVFLRSTVAKTGTASQTITTFTLPASISPRPVASLVYKGDYAYVGTPTLQESTEVVNGVNSYVYVFYTTYAGASTSSIIASTEYEMAEVTFGYPGDLASELRLVSIPDGGTTNIGYTSLEIGGTNVGNGGSLFYGTGATNSASGFSGYSFIPINVILPVKFLSFYALKNGDNAKLNWTVESDDNNKQFDVERSTDGRNFKPHATVPAKANGKSTNTYEVADYNLSKVGAPVIYYRIKQIDKNGEVTFSNIRNLNADRNGVPASIFPNPAKSSTRLLLDAAAPGKASVIVRDMHGKLVKQVNFQVIQGVNQHDINIAELSSGEYTVSVVGENFNHQLKLTKIR
ncbi:MAG TPA: T9SS type A sorting domain-containing protein [Phnomibacter sp.]|nr:T9SS type A sorting domain-containing protein [Phnomibacter sp.]